MATGIMASRDNIVEVSKLSLIGSAEGDECVQLSLDVRHLRLQAGQPGIDRILIAAMFAITSFLLCLPTENTQNVQTKSARF